MTSVVKHSGASQVLVRLTYRGKSVSLEIKDNCNGFNAEKMAGQDDRYFELLGMSERAKRLRSRLNVTGIPGNGIMVRVIIPLDENTPPSAPAISQSTLA